MKDFHESLGNVGRFYFVTVRWFGKNALQLETGD
jgi:hypothetical protein